MLKGASASRHYRDVYRSRKKYNHLRQDRMTIDNLDHNLFAMNPPIVSESGILSSRFAYS